MRHGGVLASQALTQRQQLATYFSALVHDFEHGGVNNDFLVSWLSERKEEQRLRLLASISMKSQVLLRAAQELAITPFCKSLHSSHLHMTDMRVRLLAPYKRFQCWDAQRHRRTEGDHMYIMHVCGFESSNAQALWRCTSAADGPRFCSFLLESKCMANQSIAF